MLEYKGLRAVREHINVTDEAVDRTIDNLIDRNPRVVSVEGRAAQAGDELLLDYSGEVDGRYFEGGTAENQTLTLGSGTFIPGFEDQLIGHNTGERVDVRVTFPVPYHAPELAGKEAVFHCLIHQIRLKERYEADDRFAREFAGLENFEALRAQIRAEHQAYIDRQADEELRENLLSQLCDMSGYPVDASRVEAETDRLMAALEAQLGQRNLTLELYARFTGSSVEDLRKGYVPEARRNLLKRRIIAEIAAAEGIEPDEASVARALETICRENGVTMEQILPCVDDDFRRAVEESVVVEKVLDLLIENAVIEDMEK